jgi:hypothetical protein
MTEPEIFQGPKELVAYATSCEAALLEGVKHAISYPASANSANWPADEIQSKNEEFLSTLRNAGNVYALFVADRPESSPWILRYVGERKSNGLRQRLTEHLIKKNAKTGSKLPEIQQSVSDGKRIAVSFIKVAPEALRLYVEETIIAKHKDALPWNTHG